MKVHLHADSKALPASFVTALDVPGAPRDVIVWGDRMFRLDPDHTTRLRRPTYVEATWFVSGPITQRARMNGGG
jgi:hypothetical protein